MSSIPWSISEDSLDVNFSVPQQLRLRFTQDCFGSDWENLMPLFYSDSGRSRMQWWIDESVAQAQTELLPSIHRRLQEHSSELELVSDIHVIPGGEQVKNDSKAVDQIFATIERGDLDFGS